MKTLIYFIVTLLTGLPTWAADNMSMVTGEIEQANIMRESLVGAVQGKVDSNTFRSVCKPVGERLKTVAKQSSVEDFKRNGKRRFNCCHLEASRWRALLLQKNRRKVSLFKLPRKKRFSTRFYRKKVSK